MCLQTLHTLTIPHTARSQVSRGMLKKTIQHFVPSARWLQRAPRRLRAPADSPPRRNRSLRKPRPVQPGTTVACWEVAPAVKILGIPEARGGAKDELDIQTRLRHPGIKPPGHPGHSIKPPHAVTWILKMALLEPNSP